MEKLSVYEDYLQSMAFLHASKNRLLNAIETSRVSPSDGKFITETCLQIYTTHTQRGCETINLLLASIKSRSADSIQKSMTAIHKHNRQTMRISKVFEDDVCDEHPDPDAEIVEPKVEANITITLPSSKLRQKLQVLLTEQQSTKTNN